MNKFEVILLIGCCISSLYACNSGGKTTKYKEKNSQVDFTQIHSIDDYYIVSTCKAQSGMFYLEFENNGNLKAQEQATLHYQQKGIILEVNVINGQSVKKGEVLSRIDNKQQKINYESSIRGVEYSRLSLEENLINQGYTLQDSFKIPDQIMKIALIRSGYLDAINKKELAERNLLNCSVIAPFDGIIANLEAKPFNETTSFNSFCTIINNNLFEVSFQVLETELTNIEKGMQIEISPFSIESDVYVGEISEINPKVEKNGMVKVKALVENTSGILLEGMNVKIRIKKVLGQRVFVPKEAITLRQERNVVFVCDNDTARWRYVDVGETNSKYIVIKNNINEGEEVVVEGNFNLAHLSPLKVIEQRIY